MIHDTWTLERFNSAVANAKRMRDDTAAVCRLVLVAGMTAAQAQAELGDTRNRSAINRAVQRLRGLDDTAPPKGWKRVTLDLPPELFGPEGLEPISSLEHLRREIARHKMLARLV